MQRCSGCRRHVKEDERRCPFCRARIGLASALPLAAVLASTGCVARVGIEDDGDGDTSAATVDAETGEASSSSGTEVPSTTADPAGSTSMASSESGDESADTGWMSAGFIYGDPDGNSVSIECSVWDQDCPDGEKCMPWANDGGNSWNATRCSPLSPAAGQPGDPCTVEGSGVSGVDDCDIATMCWGVDPTTNEGTCAAFCAGSENKPVCDDADTTCTIANEGTLILCLIACDPLLQNCVDGEGCYALDDNFVCVPDASGDTGAYGDPCDFIHVCNPSLFCANADIVPGCASESCCSEYCSVVDDPMGTTCTGATEGQTCLPWFDEGATPPGLEHVGACALPS